MPVITGNPYFDYTLAAVMLAAVVTTVVLMLLDAPYGRYARKGFGPSLSAVPAWVLMESPSVLLFVWCYSQGQNALQTVPLLLCSMWLLHYVHRTFIYPFTLGSGPKETMPVLVVLTGFAFNAANAYLNSSYISQYAQHLSLSWLTDPRFGLGVLLFAGGFALNKHSDRLLRRLGKESGGSYRIPYGGGFRWVSMPNYLGEIMTWSGFAIAAWSPAGLAFVLFTMANLVPRALSNHRWYHEKFADYPTDRKAIFPFLL